MASLKLPPWFRWLTRAFWVPFELNHANPGMTRNLQTTDGADGCAWGVAGFRENYAQLLEVNFATNSVNRPELLAWPPFGFGSFGIWRSRFLYSFLARWRRTRGIPFASGPAVPGRLDL